MVEHPTREQLLALQPGEELRHDGMRVYRPHHDPRNRLTERALYFSRRYLEDKLTFHTHREFVEDALADPWELISERLEEYAAEQGAHHLDGTPVTTP